MRKALLFGLLFFACAPLFAAHLKGGWIFYEYLGNGSAPNTSKYRITVNQYLSCSSTGAQIDANVFLGIFDGASNNLYQEITIAKTTTVFEEKTTFNPCINNPPAICYRIDKYVTTIDLPNNNAGYILAVQRCCRVGGIVNVNNSQNVGVTYSTKIPGVISGVVVRNNNSPLFAQKDTAIVCVNSFFTFDFSATDADSTTYGDSLAYVFCNGLVGGDAVNAQPNPPSNPPYTSVNYSNGYNGQIPMGTGVTIDAKTGIISGITPLTTGDYVVAICALEYRNGILIGQTKKEIHITVANCQLAGAQLKPVYITCNGFDVTFQNESTAPNIISYYWDFGVVGINTDTSTLPKPTYTYTDTGIYSIKLGVVNSKGCKDSTTSILKVFPGFNPGFIADGSCILNPFTFTDTSNTRYGFINSWNWNFGETTSANDTSTKSSASYTYLTAGQHNVQLIVTNSKGCIDTVVTKVTAYDKPVINMVFRDTLICGGDTVHLHSRVSGATAVFSWTPLTDISDPNIADPLVYPKVKTTYFLNANDHGCQNLDSVTVDVEKPITANILFNDTTICSIDTLHLNATTTALSPVYKWSPAYNISNVNISNPYVYPQNTTTYLLHVKDQVCNAVDSVKITVVKSINANIGAPDTTICSTDTLQLHASTNALSPVFKWTPAYNISNTTIANPYVFPKQTTTYVLNINEQQVCTAVDSITVNVVKAITANILFHDTTICSIDTLQLNATTTALAPVYKWSPAYNISNVNISNPYVYPQNTTTYLLHVKDQVCNAVDSVKITVVKSINANIGAQDTTICSTDTLQLHASTNALSPVFKWTPAYNISNTIIANPYVFPKQTTTYVLNVNEQQVCNAIDSITVNVVKAINANILFHDTIICSIDTLQLNATTTALAPVYKWSPAYNISNVNISNPYVYPQNTTTYLLHINDQACTAVDSVKIKVVKAINTNIGVHDTTICISDTLQLHATTSAVAPVFQWTPGINISNPNISDPLFYPQDTTTYYLFVKDQGVCNATDSVKINVVKSLVITMNSDTTICRGDTMQLSPITNGLNFLWTPAVGLSDPTIKNPYAFPLTTTTYQLTSSVGKCLLAGGITIKVAPYPTASLGADSASICYGNTTQLHATISGSLFTWSPASSLLNPTTLNPTAGPQNTTTYVLIVHDTLGCPKPAIDSETVKVIPPVKAYAGRDTIVVINQPLQLIATGGNYYVWSPSTGMNNPYIYDPIVILGPSVDTIIYRVKVSELNGCFAYDDIKVTVFKTMPQIFIPTGFSPNGDGRNDILKPILAGMKSLRFFRVFNRWGQMIYSTSEIGKGWDGTFNGTKQPSGTYIFEAQAEDYLGNVVVKKGTTVLIR